MKWSRDHALTFEFWQKSRSCDFMGFWQNTYVINFLNIWHIYWPCDPEYRNRVKHKPCWMTQPPATSSFFSSISPDTILHGTQYLGSNAIIVFAVGGLLVIIEMKTVWYIFPVTLFHVAFCPVIYLWLCSETFFLGHFSVHLGFIHIIGTCTIYGMHFFVYIYVTCHFLNVR